MGLNRQSIAPVIQSGSEVDAKNLVRYGEKRGVRGSYSLRQAGPATSLQGGRQGRCRGCGGAGEDVSRRKSARAGRFIRTAVCGQGQAIVKRFLACGSE